MSLRISYIKVRSHPAMDKYTQVAGYNYLEGRSFLLIAYKGIEFH